MALLAAASLGPKQPTLTALLLADSSTVLTLHGTAIMQRCTQVGGAHWFSSGDGGEVIILEDVVVSASV